MWTTLLWVGRYMYWSWMEIIFLGKFFLQTWQHTHYFGMLKNGKWFHQAILWIIGWGCQCRSLHATGWNYILDTILRILMNNELIALKFYSSSSLKHYPFFVAVILRKLNMNNVLYYFFLGFLLHNIGGLFILIPF